MKIRNYILANFILMSLSLYAQEDDTIQFNQGLPEAGIDASLYDEINLDDPPAHFEKLDHGDVPDKLRRALDEDELYSGWRQRAVWRDKNTGIFWIDFDSGAGVRSVGFSEEGSVVSVKEKTKNNKR